MTATFQITLSVGPCAAMGNEIEFVASKPHYDEQPEIESADWTDTDIGVVPLSESEIWKYQEQMVAEAEADSGQFTAQLY